MKLGATEFISAGRSSGAALSELSDDMPRNPDVKIHNIGALIWRRKAFIAYFALVGALLTGVAAFVLPPKYTATSQIVIEPTQTQIAAGVLDAVVDTHIATITSDARLRAVLASLSTLPEYEATAPSSTTGSEPAFEARLRGWLLDTSTQLREAVSTPPANQVPSDGPIGLAPPSLDEAKLSLLVRQERRSSVVSISYKSSNPVRAALIANQITAFHLNTLSQHKQLALENSKQWLDQSLVQAQLESDAADQALRTYTAIHGASIPDGGKGGEPIAEIVQQLEGVRAELAKKESKLERLRDLRRAGADMPPPTATPASPSRSAHVAQDAPVADVPNTTAAETVSISAARPVLAREVEAEVERLEHDVRVLRIQARALAERTESLQTVSGFILAERKEFQTLERKAAVAADSVRELSRLRREYKDPPATGVQLLASASVPLRPSSLSPYLYIPAAVIAFAVLGGVAASTREQLDRTFRQPRDIESGLGVPCIGLIPDALRSPNRPRRPTPDASAYPNAFAIETACAMTLAVTGHRKDGKIILLTSSHPAEGTTPLAEGLASCLQSLQQRVLLVSADVPQERIHPTTPSGAPTGLDEGFTTPPYSGDPDLGFDRLSVMELTDGDPTLLASAALIAGLKRVQERYDYIVINAPAVFVSPGIPALASMADAVLFAVRWGSTTRDVAANALALLRKPATVRRDSPPNVLAVLTRVDLKSYVQYRPGDAAEFLYDHRTRPAASSLS